MQAFRWIKSLIFVVLNALMMVRRAACMTYCAWVIWLAKWLIGLKVEVRGTPPSGEVLIAAKHQSFLDIMVIYYHSPRAKYIMKREILWTPVIGLYAYRIGCVPVNRGKRGKAIKKMIADVKSGATAAGQLVIYSQGTRVKPGQQAPYKVGTFALYDQLKQPCVPVSTNAGMFWPKGTIARQPGVAIVEFHEPIAPGIEQAEFMATLEEVVETSSNALMKEAGFDG